MKKLAYATKIFATLVIGFSLWLGLLEVLYVGNNKAVNQIEKMATKSTKPIHRTTLKEQDNVANENKIIEQMAIDYGLLNKGKNDTKDMFNKVQSGNEVKHEDIPKEEYISESIDLAYFKLLSEGDNVLNAVYIIITILFVSPFILYIGLNKELYMGLSKRYGADLVISNFYQYFSLSLQTAQLAGIFGSIYGFILLASSLGISEAFKTNLGDALFTSALGIVTYITISIVIIFFNNKIHIYELQEKQNDTSQQNTHQ